MIVMPEKIDQVINPYKNLPRALEHSSMLVDYIINEEKDEETRMATLLIVLGAVIYDSQISSCKIVLALEQTRTMLLKACHERRLEQYA